MNFKVRLNSVFALIAPCSECFLRVVLVCRVEGVLLVVTVHIALHETAHDG
jgi:hypothetical protein